MADKSVSTESLAIETKTEYTGRKFRVAFIGCGGIAQMHATQLRTFDDIEIDAGCDIEQQKLDNFRGRWGVDRLYTDWKKMLEEVKPDGVSVCTPNGVHAQPTIDALNAGCHVMVEKPMAMTPSECREMIAAGK